MTANDDAPTPDPAHPPAPSIPAPAAAEPTAAVPAAAAAAPDLPPPQPLPDAPSPAADLPPSSGEATVGTQAVTAISPAERAEIRKRHTLILIALIPAMAVAFIWFGWWPAINFVLAWVAAMLSGSAFKKMLHTPAEPSGYRIGRALCAVLLIGCLPPNLPWWGAILGGIAVDFFSRLSLHVPRWARWFRHISPVLPALLTLYLLGPVLMPGTLYQKKYPILVNHPSPVGLLLDSSVENMIRDPNADTKLPPFTWNIDSVMDADLHAQELSRGNLPHVDAISKPSPLAALRNRERGQADPHLAHARFDALDGLLGYKSGATLEIAPIALLCGILLLCMNRILAWRFVLGALVGVLFAGFMAGAAPQDGIAERCLHGIEHLSAGGLVLSLFLFAHPTALPVSATASYLQGVLLSILMVLFRRLLFQSGLPVSDATLLAVLLSALLLPTIESFTRRHLIAGSTPSTSPPA